MSCWSALWKHVITYHSGPAKGSGFSGFLGFGCLRPGFFGGRANLCSWSLHLSPVPVRRPMIVLQTWTALRERVHLLPGRIRTRCRQSMSLAMVSLSVNGQTGHHEMFLMCRASLCLWTHSNLLPSHFWSHLQNLSRQICAMLVDGIRRLWMSSLLLVMRVSLLWRKYQRHNLMSLRDVRLVQDVLVLLVHPSSEGWASARLAWKYVMPVESGLPARTRFCLSPKSVTARTMIAMVWLMMVWFLRWRDVRLRRPSPMHIVR